MTFTRYIEVLRSRWRLALTVLACALVAAALLSAFLPRQYKASASVLVDMRSPDPLASAAVAALANATGTGYMATQIDVVQSERVIRRVIKLVGFDHDPAMRQRWQDATDGRGSYEAWLADQLQKKLEILPTRESGVMSISFTASEPQAAADIANAFVRAYVDTTLELRVEPAKRYGDFFDDRSKQLRDALNAAQSRLSAYQQTNGIVATDERLDVETARLSELSTQLSAWQAASADSRSRQQASAGGANSMPEAALDPVIIGLSSELARQQLRLTDLRQRLGESNPQLLEAVAGVAQLRGQIAVEMRRVSGSVAATNQINQSREAQLRAMLDEQRVKVLRMKRQRDDASVLLRDVENAKSAYDSMQARAGQSGLESHNTQTNVSVMQEASPPAWASFPKPASNMAVAFVLGTLMALAAVLVREMNDRKVRTVDDVVVELKQKLLVVMPRSASRDPVVGPVRARILGRLPRPAR